MLIQPVAPWQTEKSIQKAAWIKVVWLLYPKINSWVYSFSTHNSIEFEFTIVTVANLRICSSLKRHKRSACATWFKRKVLNQGLEVHIKLLILSPWLRTFLIYWHKSILRYMIIKIGNVSPLVTQIWNDSRGDKNHEKCYSYIWCSKFGWKFWKSKIKHVS